MADRERRFAMVVSIVALVAGVVGFVVARNVAFTGPVGARVGRGELLGGGELFFISRFGALVFVALAVLGLVGAATGRRLLLILAGAGFAVAAVLILFQAGRGTNWLGGRGSTMALSLACALTFLVIGRARSGSAAA